MISVHFSVPVGLNSFYYSARYASAYLDQSIFRVTIGSGYKVGSINIRLNDMWNEFRKPTKADIYWLDTPLDYTGVVKPRISSTVKEIWVTSSWNHDMCRKVVSNIKCRIMPRLIHPLFVVSRVSSYEYDMAFVGSCWTRKNCNAFIETCRRLKLKCWMTGSYNRLSLTDIVDRLSRTRLLWWVTESEGFGLPLMEAQAMGVVPICIDAHANRDWCFIRDVVGDEFIVEPMYEKIVEYGGERHRIWVPNFDDVEKTISRVLSIGDSELMRIGTRLREKALNVTHRYAVELNKRLLESAVK